MDLGYSSSSEDETETISEIKETHTAIVKKPELETLKMKLIGIRTPKRPIEEEEIGDIFNLTVKKQKVEPEQGLDLLQEFKNLTEETRTENSEDADKLPPVEKSDIPEFDMDKFYQTNEDAIQSGELNPEKQLMQKKIVFHGSVKHGSGLSDVMKWNMTNEDKLQYQNDAEKQKILEIKKRSGGGSGY